MRDMKQIAKNYLIVALGSALFAVAFDVFYAPNDVAMCGVTGLAQVINRLIPALPVGTLSFCINVPIFLLGWRMLGFHLLATSLFSTVVSSAVIDLLGLFTTFPPMDPLLACLCGGAAMGLGLGMVFSQGATTGGTDIVARLLKLKFPWLPMGKLMMVPDGIVLMLAAIVFGRLEAALYGVVGTFVATRVIDKVLYGLDTSKVAYIISEKWQEIEEVLVGVQDRGMTEIPAIGTYTGENRKIQMVVFRQKDIVQIKRAVCEIDPGAFIIVCDAHEVLGQGFGTYQKEEI